MLLRSSTPGSPVTPKSPQEAQCPDLLATTGDILRVWKISDEGVQLERALR